MTPEGPTFLGVSIHADECALLREILEDWIGEGFSVEGPKVDLAHKLCNCLDVERLLSPD